MARKKRPSRAESRKTPEVSKVPESIREISDPRMRTVAMTLALNGYQRNANRRTGAVTHAARLADVARKTIYEWLELPEFVTAIEEAISELISECFTGYRLGVAKGDGKSCGDFLAHLDPSLDLTLQRKREEWAHEEKMLRLKIELAEKTPTEQRVMPSFVYRETQQGERIVTPRDEDLN